MKNRFLLIPVILSLFVLSCNSKVSHLFEKKTAREKYEDKLDDAGIDNTPAGRAWKAASERSLIDRQAITLPYRLQGHFPQGKPRALGLEFHLKQGEQAIFELSKSQGSILYADIFEINEGSSFLKLSIDPDSVKFSFAPGKKGSFILRLQPALESTGDYKLSIHTTASLGFPVSGNKARTGSFWGDDRDGGKRNHEGIDIFAARGTPAVAAADGYITAVKNGGLGGKTVSLRPTDEKISLYYAHLDKQLVTEGQYVKKGEVIGTVGNTGNAQHTPSHLHFGIYTNSGPVDPFPYVNPSIKTAPAVPVKELAGSLKLLRSQAVPGGNKVEANTIVYPIAYNEKGYIAELPDGKLIQTPFNVVSIVKEIASPKTVETTATSTSRIAKRR